MCKWRVIWGTDNEREVVSREELASTLDELSEKYHGDNAIMAELESPDGSALAIGLGRSESVVTFVSASGDPPYYISIRSDKNHESDVVVFFYRGTWTEFSARHSIPIELARKASIHFFEHHALLESVDWEEG